MFNPLKIAATANLVHLFDFDSPPADPVHIRLTLNVARQLLELLPRFIEEARALGMAGVGDGTPTHPNVHMMSDYLRDLGFRWIPALGREEDHVGEWYSTGPSPKPLALTPTGPFYRNTLRLYLLLRSGELHASIGQP